MVGIPASFHFIYFIRFLFELFSKKFVVGKIWVGWFYFIELDFLINLFSKKVRKINRMRYFFGWLGVKEGFAPGLKCDR